MIINKININKITKAFELTCPMFKENLITEAFIVGSVAKGIAREDSDIDIYLINPLFRSQFNTHGIDLPPYYIPLNPYINKIVDLLKNIDAKPERIKRKSSETHKIDELLIYWTYKSEIFHFMYDYESESIKKGGEYIEITEEFCNEVNES